MPQAARLSRTDPNAWNELIAYLSAGLLYGHEVQRPSWFPRPERASRVEWARPEASNGPPFQLITPHSSIITSPRDRKIAYTSPPQPLPQPAAAANRIPPSRRKPHFQKIAATLHLQEGHRPLARPANLQTPRRPHDRPNTSPGTATPSTSSGSWATAPNAPKSADDC